MTPILPGKARLKCAERSNPTIALHAPPTFFMLSVGAASAPSGSRINLDYRRDLGRRFQAVLCPIEAHETPWKLSSRADGE
jgi:hypothetical protein